MSVTSWKRRSGCASNKSGASFLIAASNFSASSPGIPYHVFVSPQCTELGKRGKRGEADQKNSTRHILGDDILTEIHRVSVVVLSFRHGKSEAAINSDTTHLIMPTEGGEYHANIRPRYSHARDIRLDVTEKRVRDNRNVVQVPWVLGIRVHWMRLKSRHSAAR